jgi:hypothetical protein
MRRLTVGSPNPDPRVPGLRADYALPVAGVALVLSLIFPKGHAQLVRKQA